MLYILCAVFLQYHKPGNKTMVKKIIRKRKYFIVLCCKGSLCKCTPQIRLELFRVSCVYLVFIPVSGTEPLEPLEFPEWWEP